MGAGTNVQRRLVHSITWMRHATARYRATGRRILRQGNANKEVQIFAMSRKARSTPICADPRNKGAFHQQVMRGETSVRSAEDLESGALTYAEIKRLLPVILPSLKRSRSIRKSASSTSCALFTPINSATFVGRFVTYRDRLRKRNSIWQYRSRHHDQKCNRDQRVHHDGRQSRFLRQGCAGASGHRSDFRGALLA